MGHDWIVDVLVDLRNFARDNGLISLAAHLDDAALVAQVELTSGAEGTGSGLCSDTSATRRSVRGVGIS